MAGLFCVTKASALEADVSVSRFYAGDKAYLEMFVYVLGNSVTSVASDSAQQASVNITYYISTAGNVVAGNRYNLVSKGMGGIADFMDLRRHFMEPGNYSVVVELVDNYDTTNTVTLTKSIIIASAQSDLAQSDILLLANIEASAEEGVWIRSGWRMTPMPYAWFHEGFDILYFYHELYHTDIRPAQDFYVQFAVVPDADPEKILIQTFKRMKPRTVNTLVQSIDIAGLSSGEYLLRVSVFDQARNPLSSVERKFIRTNPKADMEFVESASTHFENSFTHLIESDSMRYALKALVPKVSQIQAPVLNYLIERGELENQRRFLHQYWIEVDPAHPETAYREYMQLAAVVDEEYHSAFGYGFETDRGHILLKYGFPNDVIAVDDEPSAPPYEIWFYHAFPVTGQNDVRFLFYNPSLAGGDYRLLHSTAIGEVRNPRWQQVLYSDALTEPAGGDFLDGTDVDGNFHRRAVEYFTD